MIPERSAQDRSAIGHLPYENGPGHPGRLTLIVGPAVLLPPKEHITGDRPLNPGQKPAMLRKKAEAHPLLRAKAHQKRAAGNLAEADDPPDGVDRELQEYLSFIFHHHGLAFLGEIGPLGGHK